VIYPIRVPSKNSGPYGLLANARSQVETLQLASATASNVRNLGYVIMQFDVIAVSSLLLIQYDTLARRPRVAVAGSESTPVCA
jgi:hypothetical protein